MSMESLLDKWMDKMGDMMFGPMPPPQPRDPNSHPGDILNYNDRRLALSWGRNAKRDAEGRAELRDAEGNHYWLKNGELDNDKGPAAVYVNGDKEYWKGGKLHRTDGPARDRADGSGEWYIEDRKLTDDEVSALKAQLLVENARSTTDLSTLKLPANLSVPKETPKVAAVAKGFSPKA